MGHTSSILIVDSIRCILIPFYRTFLPYIEIASNQEPVVLQLRTSF